MDRTQVPLLALIIFLPLATGLTFHVQIGDHSKYSALNLNYMNNTSGIQEINASVGNTGSLGCVYRLKTDFIFGNRSQLRYSKPYPLFPGDRANVELRHLIPDYNGEVEARVNLTFCDKNVRLDNITYNLTEKHVANETLEPRVKKVTEEKASINLPVEEAELIPRKVPPHWKTSVEKTSKGEAEIGYYPPIYKEGEELSYTVWNSTSQEVIGETTVKLEEEQNMLDTVKSRLLEILLAISLLLNLVLGWKAFRTLRK